MRTDVPMAIVPCLLRLFPRHRWTGADVVTRDCALAALLHSLLMDAVPLWADGVDPAAIENGTARLPADDSDDEGEGEGGGGAAAALEDECFDSDASSPDLDSSAAADHALVAQAAGAMASDNSVDWAAFNARMRGNASNWAARHPRAALMIMFRSISLTSQALHAFLFMAGQGWETTADLHVHQGVAPRPYRLAEAHDRRDELRLAAGVLRSLTDPIYWHKRLHRSEKTFYNRSLAFRLFSRQVASVFIYLELPRRGFPFVLFSMLSKSDRVAAARRILSMPQCCRDDFSHDVLFAWSTPEQLASDEAVAVLQSIAEVTRTETSAIETGHAYVLRQSSTRGLHCKAEDFIHASAAFTLCKARTFEMKPGLQSAAKRPAKLGRRSRRGGAKGPEVVKRRRKLVRGQEPQRGRGGGMWKTFVHEATCDGKRKGHFGGSVFAGLSLAYHALSPEEKQALQVRGDAFCEEHALTPSGNVYARAAPAAASVRQALEFLEARGAAAAAAPAAGAHEAPGAGAVVPAGGHVAGNGALAFFAPPPWRKVLAKLTGQARQASRRMRAARADQLEALQEWAKQQVSEFPVHGQLPAQRPLPLRPLPAATPLFEFNAPAIPLAKAVLSEAGQPGNRSGNPNKDKYHKTLGDQWARQHLMYRHRDCTPLGRVPSSRLTLSLCRHAGRCLCGETDFSERFVAALVEELRPFFAKGHALKKLLENAEGVVQRRRISCRGLADGWFHLAFVNQKSWAIGTLRLEEDDRPEIRAVAEALGHVALVACKDLASDTEWDDPELDLDDPAVWDFLGVASAYCAFRSYDFKKRYSFSLHHIVSSEARQVGNFRPADVEVRRLTQALAQPQILKAMRRHLSTTMLALPGAKQSWARAETKMPQRRPPQLWQFHQFQPRLHPVASVALGIHIAAESVGMADMKTASYEFLRATQYSDKVMGCYWNTMGDMASSRPCRRHPNAHSCSLPPPLHVDMFVCCTPCQPFTRVRSTSRCTDHNLFGSTFAEDDSVLAVARAILPKCLILEQVEGFHSQFQDLARTPLQNFLGEMLNVKRRCGTTHFSGHCVLRLNSKPWITCSRPRLYVVLAVEELGGQRACDAISSRVQGLVADRQNAPPTCVMSILEVDAERRRPQAAPAGPDAAPDDPKWKKRSMDVRSGIGMPLDAAPWTSTHRLAGVSRAPRHLDVIDVAWWTHMKCTGGRSDGQCAPGLFVDYSQNVDRKPWTSDIATFLQNSTIYSFKLDAKLTEQDKAKIMGFPDAVAGSLVNAVSASAASSLIGEGVHFACVGAVIMAAFVSEEAEWWIGPRCLQPALKRARAA
ncbi:unnamed protein product [Prorocentrum cordatum]|uniref:Uncharacterized protein n=1 Tax=Prorocentrum cordatum TaxID=2364126 RepID=A0ABN9UPF5_9DINO|nr:unnamed protein product [Polarella glacialis]